MTVPFTSPDKEPILRFLVDDRFRLYRHLCLLLILGVIFISENRLQEYSDATFRWLQIGSFGLTILLIYMNTYWLLPRYLFRGQYWGYIGWALLMVVISFGVYKQFKHLLPTLRIKPSPAVPPADIWSEFTSFTIILGIIWAATSAFKLFQKWVVDHYRIIQLENLHMHTELDLLKSQVNPHFLFNMLNNTQVLIRNNPEKASQVVGQLSSLLRYQLYDSSRKLILLTADIQFLVHLLSLEQTRRDLFQFEVEQQGTTRPILIPPLLFVPFVENAVKHTFALVQGAWVKVLFAVTAQQLYFECTNPKLINPQPGIKTGGLGLPNVKRRLELLFPGKHTLIIKEDPEKYQVCLTLAL